MFKITYKQETIAKTYPVVFNEMVFDGIISRAKIEVFSWTIEEVLLYSSMTPQELKENLMKFFKQKQNVLGFNKIKKAIEDLYLFFIAYQAVLTIKLEKPIHDLNSPKGRHEYQKDRLWNFMMSLKLDKFEYFV